MLMFYFSLTFSGKYLALLLLLLTGALRPSVTSAVYYLVFLGGATWWASFKDLGRGFVVVCRIVSVVAASHITALLAYQTQYLQELLLPKTPFARYHCLDSHLSKTDVSYLFYDDSKCCVGISAFNFQKGVLSV